MLSVILWFELCQTFWLPVACFYVYFLLSLFLLFSSFFFCVPFKYTYLPPPFWTVRQIYTYVTHTHMYICVDIHGICRCPARYARKGFHICSNILFYFLFLFFVLFFEIANNNCKKWNWYFRTKLPLTRWEPSNNSFCLSNFIFASPPRHRPRFVFPPHRPTARRASRKMERLRQVNGKLFTVVPKWCNFACSCNSISCQRKRASLCSPIVVKHPQKDTPLSPSLPPLLLKLLSRSLCRT